jgi:hypothetical protein
MPIFRKRPALLVALAAAALLLPDLAREARAQASIVDFEREPALPPQPATFFAAGPMQTYAAPGLYAIGGGVVLGNPTFLPAFAAAGTSPNLYGTTDIADPTLLPVLTLDIPAEARIIYVKGTLFNGQPIPEDYVVDAFSGLTPVGSQTFSALPENFNGGFGIFSLLSEASPITRVTITTPNTAANGWTFFVDGLALQPVPEPPTLAPVAAGGLGLLAVRRRRRA